MGRNKKQQPNQVQYKGFITLPQVLLKSERFINLHPRSVKLLLDIAQQYNGFNNGDLQATMSCLKSRGWSSNDHLTKATRELLDKELIVRTRLGGFRFGCSLYALSWQPIDECGGKLEVQPTTNPPVDWLKEEKMLHERRALFNARSRPKKPQLKPPS